MNSNWRFNPRSHAGSDNVRFRLFNVRYVSIHAPTRGATCLSPLNAHN